MVELKSCIGGRYDFAAFCILLDDFDVACKLRIVNQVLILKPVFRYFDLKGGYQFCTFPAGNLFYNISAIWQIF